MQRRTFIKCSVGGLVVASTQVSLAGSKFNVYAIDYHTLHLTKIGEKVSDPEQVILDLEGGDISLKYYRDAEYLTGELRMFEFASRNIGKRITCDKNFANIRVSDENRGLMMMTRHNDGDYRKSIDLIEKHGVVFPHFMHDGREYGLDEGDAYIIERV